GVPRPVEQQGSVVQGPDGPVEEVQDLLRVLVHQDRHPWSIFIRTEDHFSCGKLLWVDGFLGYRVKPGQLSQATAPLPKRVHRATLCVLITGSSRESLNGGCLEMLLKEESRGPHCLPVTGEVAQ